MNYHIIYAHFESKSFNAALKQQAETSLQKQNHHVVVSDLYALSFNPVAGRSDFRGMHNESFFKYDNEQLYASKNDLYAREIKAEQEKVAWADHLVFIFPLWWYSAPAILRGWFDKVLSNGFAYTNEDCYGRGLLTGKTAQIIVTTGASEDVFCAEQLGTIEDLLKGITHTFQFCGMRSLPIFCCYAADSIAIEKRRSYLDLLDKELHFIQS